MVPPKCQYVVTILDGPNLKRFWCPVMAVSKYIDSVDSLSPDNALNSWLFWKHLQGNSGLEFRPPQLTRYTIILFCGKTRAQCRRRRPTIRDIGRRTNAAVAEPRSKVNAMNLIYCAARSRHQNSDIRFASEDKLLSLGDTGCPWNAFPSLLWCRHSICREGSSSKDYTTAEAMPFGRHQNSTERSLIEASIQSRLYVILIRNVIVPPEYTYFADVLSPYNAPEFQSFTTLAWVLLAIRFPFLNKRHSWSMVTGQPTDLIYRERVNLPPCYRVTKHVRLHHRRLYVG